VARSPRRHFPGAPEDPKGSAHAKFSGGMRVGHPRPPAFANRRQQKRWYKSHYKHGVVAKGTGVVTTYKRGRLVKSNAGAKTLSQKKVNLARRRHRVNRVKRAGRGALALGAAGLTAYGVLSSNPSTAKATARYTNMAKGRATHAASTVKTRRNLRRIRRDRKGMFR
jgi:hypothetical protein